MARPPVDLEAPGSFSASGPDPLDKASFITDILGVFFFCVRALCGLGIVFPDQRPNILLRKVTPGRQRRPCGSFLPLPLVLACGCSKHAPPTSHRPPPCPATSALPSHPLHCCSALQPKPTSQHWSSDKCPVSGRHWNGRGLWGSS